MAGIWNSWVASGTRANQAAFLLLLLSLLLLLLLVLLLLLLPPLPLPLLPLQSVVGSPRSAVAIVVGVGELGYPAASSNNKNVC